VKQISTIRHPPALGKVVQGPLVKIDIHCCFDRRLNSFTHPGPTANRPCHRLPTCSKCGGCPTCPNMALLSGHWTVASWGERLRPVEEADKLQFMQTSNGRRVPVLFDESPASSSPLHASPQPQRDAGRTRDLSDSVDSGDTSTKLPALS